MRKIKPRVFPDIYLATSPPILTSSSQARSQDFVQEGPWNTFRYWRAEVVRSKDFQTQLFPCNVQRFAAVTCSYKMQRYLVYINYKLLKLSEIPFDLVKLGRLGGGHGPHAPPLGYVPASSWGFEVRTLKLRRRRLHTNGPKTKRLVRLLGMEAKNHCP